MKDILIISRNFPPLVGGMERLIEQATRQLRRKYNCTLIGPAGCEDHVDINNNVYGYPISPLPRFLTSSMLRALACARKKHFCFCLSGSGLTAPIAGLAKTLYKIPAVTFIHGLDLIADNSLYQRFFIPWLKQMDIVIANSENTARIALEKGVSRARIRILHPGVDTQQKSPEKGAFISSFGLEGKKILLSAGRLVPRKGLAEFLLYSFPKIVYQIPETVLIIIGEEPQKALKTSSGYSSELVKIIDKKNLGDNVMLLGYLPDDILLSAYQDADLFVFPLIETPGDVEGFGMVATEAAANGLPTVAFATGGVTDAVSQEKSGYLVKAGDYEAFTSVILNHIQHHSTTISSHSCIEFAESLSWENFGKNLMKICSSI